MTEPAVVPAWVTADWARHAHQSAEHFCATCGEYLVPVAGAICPVCSSTSRWDQPA